MTTQGQRGPRATYIALESIGRAIRDLDKPRGTVQIFDGFGGVRVEDDYRTETPAEKLAVTEDLIGAAFVLAQTYTHGKGGAPFEAIRTVANYWKHRDQWDARWSEIGPNVGTIRAVKTLGLAPPVAVGQLSTLAEWALCVRFDVDALRRAINP
jgi:hypothetical protein